uniref:Uncharacterized protein n=1 Tax=Ciona savignyi TaxID=51511 RepID=H2ZD38_CIOSA
MYHQIATNATPSQYSHKTSDALSYQQAPRPYDQSGSWGHQKVMAQGGPGIMGAQPPISILGKAPRAPVVQGSVQRYPTMQGYQFTPQQLAVAARAQQQIGTFQMKPQPSGIRMNSPTSINQQFGTPMDYPNYSGPKQGKGGKSAVPTAVVKAPPVPTLVRGVGSNLVGKKPTFIPEDVVKSKQASERASLLQSLSAFFPDKGKNEGEEQSSSENTDWSSQVACSSPLPKRKPGMRHPGVDRRRLNAAKDDKSRSGPIGAAKIYPAKSEEVPVNENLVQTTKKLTLADTRPKKGETAQIPL